jgi:hypothetical protein
MRGFGVPTRRVRPLEGRACRVRSVMLDHLFRFVGHDKHAPPIRPSEGPACQVRETMFVNPSIV